MNVEVLWACDWLNHQKNIFHKCDVRHIQLLGNMVFLDAIRPPAEMGTSKGKDDENDKCKTRNVIYSIIPVK